MSHPWQHEDSFAVTNAHMLSDDVLCDVTILAGEEAREVRCHRFILASRSPVFYTMFCGSLPEAGVVKIPDVEADVVRTVVRFMYTGEIQLMPDSVMAVMYAAKKYDIQPLTNRCNTFLETEIAVDNVCVILDQALKFAEEDLIQPCLSFVSKNTDQVFQSDGFLSMSSEALKLVLEKEKDSPHIPPEEVYAFCKRWARQACSSSGTEVTDQVLRHKLRDLICLVDFAGMSYESFTDNVVQETILSDNEKVKFLTDIRKRQKKEQTSFVVERFSEVQQGWGHYGLQDGISFKTSKHVKLSGVVLYLPHQSGSLSGQLEILEEQTVVLTQDVTLSYKENEKHEHIPLVNRFNIHPGVTYSVRQRLKGQVTYKGAKYKGKQRINGIEIEFMELTSGKSDNGTILNVGQIHGLTLEC
ncbi:BTB/POZ domain-containing protein 2-like isoform X1 [Mya arenaria]|nr:BTB/POZ domain-containing protein 2-like isoform X1 [Mya arenaria]XP_052784537.1 BTB/POZ domain-containing protein 2-like isoform X1 [Mya arenaria]XP_052784539.1 BTB/POZ domain-containing protein 2-like isoform X1 [Mya arenaria]XP_052784540.1 BTB/POZ domain-containing protein 2-like isoform X1 [Mya arenaria]XP_052784541.1 BTB/POZ domain-containing protein 2-like isoform X1 [Mya arenaria]